MLQNTFSTYKQPFNVLKKTNLSEIKKNRAMDFKHRHYGARVRRVEEFCMFSTSCISAFTPVKGKTEWRELKTVFRSEDVRTCKAGEMSTNKQNLLRLKTTLGWETRYVRHMLTPLEDCKARATRWISPTQAGMMMGNRVYSHSVVETTSISAMTK